jgi:uroporphyrinogen decarboxylase
MAGVTGSSDSRFLRACRRAPVDRTPVWLMRQAGRYMSGYREIRKSIGMLDLIKRPDLSCQVTMQPIDAFDLDAAIIFADILPPLGGLGLKVGFEAGEGPIVYNPVRDEADVLALATPDIQEATGFTLEAIRLARRELDSRGIPLIGFSGAPFTLACYSVEGGSSKDFTITKRLMMGRPDLWRQLMDKLTELIGGYLRAQAEAGAQALQLFDTWAGLLSPSDYREFALPYNQAVIREASKAGVPVIYFSTGTSGILELVAQSGADVIGVDWRVDLGEAWRRLGSGVAIQGNLDPVALLGDWPELKKRAAAVLESAAGRPGHIFNLGHGVLRDTSVDSVRRLVDYVHEYRSERLLKSDASPQECAPPKGGS